MAYIIHIETSTDICSVALAESGQLVQEVRAEEPLMHISKLSTLIDDLLHHHQVSYGNLAAVVISTGPGSYTGLRVGYATAKGLCLACSIPLIEVDTLYSLAWGLREAAQQHTDARYISMIDARRKEVYAAFFDAKLAVTKAPHPLILNTEVISSLMDDSVTYIIGGNGAHKVSEILPEVNESKNLIISDLGCDASFLIDQAWSMFVNEEFSDLAYCEPLYIKPPNITVSKKKHPLD